jgi:AraC-like DNA-binding protein
MEARRTVHRWVVFHETYSFCLVDRIDQPAKVDWRYNRRTYTVDPGNAIMMMQPGELHANIQETPPGDFVVVQVGDGLMRQVARELGWRLDNLDIRHPSPGQGHPAFIGALRRFRDGLCRTLFDAGSPKPQCRCFGSVERHMENLTELVQEFIANCVENAQGDRASARDSPVVRKAIDYLHDNASEPYSLARLAEAAGCQKYYLSHRFKREMGASPQEHVNGIRIANACRLLATQPEWTLERVVSELNWPGRPSGAEDAERVSVMIRHFKRTMLLTPGEFRASLARMSRKERVAFATHAFRRTRAARTPLT